MGPFSVIGVCPFSAVLDSPQFFCAQCGKTQLTKEYRSQVADLAGKEEPKADEEERPWGALPAGPTHPVEVGKKRGVRGLPSRLALSFSLPRWIHLPPTSCGF